MTEASPTLADLTTIRVGGAPERLVRVSGPGELVDAVREVDDAEEPLLLVSGGSNLLVADGTLPGTVVKVDPPSGEGLEVLEEDDEHVRVRVAGGADWDAVVADAVDRGWSGIEALSGIPGATGATPVQNVGAYGQEVAQTITAVRAWDRRSGEVVELTPQDCAFAYRHSVFKDQLIGSTPRLVVLDVTFRLARGPLSAPIGYAALANGLGVDLGERVPLAQARAAVLEQRGRRGMVLDAADHDTWSCGSFFTNPLLTEAQFDAVAARAADRGAGDPPRFDAGPGRVKTSAAWLIQQAGYERGHGDPARAALSTKHTLALTNRGAASAADLLALAREVRDGVEAAFGVRLVNEPTLVGLTL